MTSILNQPAVQIAALVLSGLFLLNQTRKRGIVLSLICMVAWLGVVIIVVDMIREPSQELSVIVSRRVEIIDEIELVQLGPIINTETERQIVVLPNEQVQEAPRVGTSWGNTQRSFLGTQRSFLGTQRSFPSAQRSFPSVSEDVARWQPHNIILKKVILAASPFFASLAKQCRMLACLT